MIKKIFSILIFSLLISACTSVKKSENKVKTSSEEETEMPVDISDVVVKTLNYNQLEPLLNRKDGKVYIINFWATWCKPCVEELPAFEKLNTHYKDRNVEIILVSLDFPKQVKKRVKPFLKRKNVHSKVVLLDEVNDDFWSQKINENWSGAIPATLIYNKDKRQFYEQSFTYESLEIELHKFLTPIE
jgi:thiol-disulfide isomerase/thioredoxin